MIYSRTIYYRKENSTFFTVPMPALHAFTAYLKCISLAPPSDLQCHLLILLYTIYLKIFTIILSPLAGRTGHTVKNSYEFVDTITRLKFNDVECIVSFDVVSLFTKISVDVAKSVIFELLSKDECLQHRTKLCLKELMLGINICLDNIYIQFKNQFYKQIFGVPMGSPILVTIANLVMETVETKAL